MASKGVFVKSILLPLFVFYALSLSATSSCQGKENNRSAQQIFDTLTIIISASNYVYYYNGSLKMNENESNFKMTTIRGIKDVINLFEMEAKDKTNQLLVLLKIQKKSTLTSVSSEVIAFIEENCHYKFLNLNETDSQLIAATEKANSLH